MSMNALSSISMYDLILISYLIVIAAINLVAFMISDFYRKKFNQPAPRLGYCVSIGLALLVCASIVFMRHDTATVRFIRTFLLLGSGVLSMYSSLTLFFTMNKVRK